MQRENNEKTNKQPIKTILRKIKLLSKEQNKPKKEKA